jgi:hypothetical protein
MAKEVIIDGEKHFPQSEVDAMMADSFNAGREEMVEERIGKKIYSNGNYMMWFKEKYKTFNDYKATLPLQQVPEKGLIERLVDAESVMYKRKYEELNKLYGEPEAKDKPFVWDEKLLFDFMNSLWSNDKFSYEDFIQELNFFKQSKQSPTNLQESKPEAGVAYFDEAGKKIDEVTIGKKQMLSFETLCFSQQEKLDMAAEFIGKYRHDHTMTNHRIAHSLLYPTTTMNAYKSQPYTTVKDKQEYEILSYEFDGRVQIPNIEPYIELSKNFKDKCHTISRVKRLPDNIIVEVGKTKIKHNLYPEGLLVKEIKLIKNEGYNWEEIHVFAGGRTFLLKWLNIQPELPTPNTDTISSKPVLFTTSDGVDIKNGDWAWYVQDDNNWMIVSHSGITEKRPYPYFSTKEIANNWVLENKPCLSLNDILEVGKTTPNITRTEHDEDYYKKSTLYKAFEQKAKEKLNSKN